MRAGILLAVLLLPGLAAAQDDGDHKGTFEELLAHHSLEDLQKWRERHPWSLGDRVAGVLEEMLATRRAGERLAIEKANLTVAFLAETIAQDPMSGWLVGFLRWETEDCARQETASEAMKLLPAMIAGSEGDAAWAQIEEFRGMVREGGWPLLGPDLARCAAAYLHAGDRARAKTIATELAGSAESLQQGVVLAASERILGEIARLEGEVPEAIAKTKHSFEIRSGFDSGPAASALESNENLDACEIDTLIELAAGEKETLLVVFSGKGSSVRSLPIGRAALVDRIRSFVGASKFEATAARELYQTLLGSDGTLLEGRIGIVADAALADLPFEALVSDAQCDDRAQRFLGVAHAVVRISRPPLGGPIATHTPPPTKRTWLMVEGDTSLFFLPPGTKDEVRRSLGPSLDEIKKSAVGCTDLFFYAEVPDVQGLRGWKLDAELAVLAKSRMDGLPDAFHAAGVRDVLGCLHAPGTSESSLPANVCARMALGKPLLEAILEARAERASDPWTWAFWVVWRRS